MSFFASIIVPPIFILICLLFTLLIPELDETVPLDIQYAMFENSTDARKDKITSFIIKDAVGDRYDSIYEALTSKPGFGTFCSDSDRSKTRRDQTINWAREKGFDATTRYCNESFLEINENSWREISDQAEWTAIDAGESGWTECYCTEGDYIEPLMNCGKYENDKIYGDQKKYSGGTPLKMRNSYDGLNIVDLNGKNVSDWLLKTVDKNVFTFRRYGGFSLGADR